MEKKVEGKKGILFVVSAPAGAGKTTLVKMLTEEFPHVVKSISCTTRAPRFTEVPDQDYHFISQEEFEKKIAQGKFLEYVQLFDHYYGTLQEEVLKQQEQGKHVVLILDTTGALALRKRPFPAVFIFIYPPSIEELRLRLINRQTETPESIEKRMREVYNDIARSLFYDYVVTNDDLSKAYSVLRSILIAEEHRMRFPH